MMEQLRAVWESRSNGLPDRLSRPAEVVPADWRLVSLLFAAALAPRLLCAVRQPCLCFDSVRYLQWSAALGEGRFDETLSYLNINIYPVLLNTFRASGLDLVVWARSWSVLAATLVVLPLYGWLRRQFNEPIAILSCLLYAVHDAFSADAPLIVRDSTFWLLMTLSLYLAWRAATETRWWQFVAAGIAFTLAVHTRTEGWLLVLPIGGWLAGAFFDTTRRGRAAVGTVVLAAMLPLFLFAFNVTVLKGHDRWEWGRFDRVETVGTRLSHVLSIAGAGDPTEVAPTDGPSTLVLLRKQGARLIKTVGFIHGALLLVGMAAWRRFWFRRDQFPLFLFSWGNILAVWMVWQTSFDRRYYLPLTLVSLPYMAGGLVTLSGMLSAWFGRRGASRARVLGGLASGVCIACMLMIVLRPRPFEEAQLADFGTWIRHTQGPSARVVVNEGRASRLRYMTYFADCRFETYASPDCVVELAETRPSVIAFWKYDKRSFWDTGSGADFRPYEETFRRLETLGFRRVDPRSISPRCGRFVVLVSDRTEREPLPP